MEVFFVCYSFFSAVLLSVSNVVYEWVEVWSQGRNINESVFGVEARTTSALKDIFPLLSLQYYPTKRTTYFEKLIAEKNDLQLLSSKG